MIMGEDGKRPCVESVRRTLSDTFVAYFMAHSFHWNVKGPLFAQFHDWFADYAGDLYGTVDAWAENMLKLGADAPYNLDSLLDNATIQEVEVTDDPMMMIQVLHGANSAVLESLKATFKLATELGYDGLADYTAGRIDQHDKWAWQLRVFMGSNGDPMHVGEMPGKSEADQPVIAIEDVPSVVADQHVPEGVAYKVNNPAPVEEEWDPIFFAAEGETMTAAAKKSGASTPAPKKDRIKGSDENKPGSADGKGKIKFSDKTETALSNKVEEHNKTAPSGRKATLAMLKAVYRRGAGAYSTSHRPGKTRDQWAMARVNAFLKLLKSGKPENSAYTTDNDLLPAAHPKSSKSQASVEAELSIEIGSEQDYESPEAAILALTEFSGFGYEIEPAVRASWMRAVRTGDNPFNRAKHLVEFTYSSLDADLLPREQKGI